MQQVYIRELSPPLIKLLKPSYEAARRSSLRLQPVLVCNFWCNWKAISHASVKFRSPITSSESCLQATGRTTPGSRFSRLLEVVIGRKILQEVALLLHDAIELVHIDSTIAITVGLVDHVLELLIVDCLTKLLSHTGEVLEGDLGAVVVIEQLKDLLDVLTGVLLAHLGSHHAAELDGAVPVVVNVGDHFLQLLVLDLEAEGAHGSLELTNIDGAGGVIVEEGERLADLVNLLLREGSSLLLHSTARHVGLPPC